MKCAIIFQKLLKKLTMKSKLNIFYKILPFIFILLGFIYCILFFYTYFIRERLPRDIPFVLTEFKFYIILFVLFIYFFIIKQIIWPKPMNPLILQIISIITIPFVHFDSFIKHNKFLYQYYFKLFCYISKHFRHSFFVYDNILLLIICNILPRVLLLTIFMFDVFLLHKIEIFYYFVILGLLPLIYNYFKYSIEFALEQYIKQLESIYNEISILEEGNFLLEDVEINSEYLEKGYYGKQNKDAIYHDAEVSIRKYIEIQRDTILYFFFNRNKNVYSYEGTPYVKEEVYLEYRKKNNKLGVMLDDSDYEQLHSTFRMLEYNLIYLSIFIKCTKDLHEIYFLKKINLIVYILYFICWFYILIISWNSIDNLPITLNVITLMQKYSVIFDSFSETSLLNFITIFYLKKKEVRDILKNHVEKNEQQLKLKNLIQEYKKIKNLQDNERLQKFYNNTQKAIDKNTFNKFKNKIKEYENKSE